MSPQIRIAKPEDASAISQIAAEAFNLSIDPDDPRVRQILSDSLTYVATRNNRILGFVDNFWTKDSWGRPRLELDLLAVARQARGEGLGSRLIAKSLEIAKQAAAMSIRALVRRDNLPMQRICQHCGFRRSAQSYHLYVSEPRGKLGNPVADHRARFIAVDTLSYRGIWLEGELSQTAIDLAHALAFQSGASLIGAVVAANDRSTARLLGANAFDRVGEFDWWVINC